MFVKMRDAHRYAREAGTFSVRDYRRRRRSVERRRAVSRDSGTRAVVTSARREMGMPTSPNEE